MITDGMRINPSILIFIAVFPGFVTGTPLDRLRANVDEAGSFDLLYELEIPDDGVFQNTTPVPYKVDNSGSLTGSFNRVGYYLERNEEWVLVVMDAFDFDPVHLGIPHHQYNPVSYQQVVTNMRVWASTGANVSTGVFANTGNIEFWSNNYGNNNASGVPNADQGGNRYDWGDAINVMANPGYGSFQVHNHDIDGQGTNTQGEVILAYNHWGSGGIDDIGIGSRPTSDPDWTFAGNANTFTNKNLLILVSPGPKPESPTGLRTVFVSDTSYEVAWDAVSNAVEYIVYRDGIEWSRVTDNTFGETCQLAGSFFDIDVRVVTAFGLSSRTNSLRVVMDTDHVTARVPEAVNFETLYSLDIPSGGPFVGTNTAPYCVNRAGVFTQNYDRIAYYLELDDGLTNTWVYASMDAFSLFPERLALPHHMDNPVSFAEIVSNLHVFASDNANVTTGEFAHTGNIEFWPSNYNGSNELGVPNATSIWDFGDGGFSTAQGYGSFQVHNHDIDGEGPGNIGETLFAYNRWGQEGSSDLGIGNNPTGELDWTFAQNAGQYQVRSLRILVRPSGAAPVPEVPANVAQSGTVFCQTTLNWDVVPFATNYVIAVNGTPIVTNTVPPVTIDNLVADMTYGMSVAAVGPGGMSAFSEPVDVTTPTISVFDRVTEVLDFEVVYALQIEDNAQYRNQNPVAYCLNRSSELTNGYDRIAYYLELNDGVVDQWVYVSMDPFTTNITEVGLPHNVDNPVALQRVVSNMTVIASSNANVTTGQFESTGLIEFWSSNYTQENSGNIPNASDTAWDFGDGGFGIGAGHGSFQVHNFDIDGEGTNTMGETIFAYNAWGASPVDALGIGSRLGNNPDWTFAGNTPSYQLRNLFVLVRVMDGDRDQDGVSDADEAIAGTNPDDPNSFPHLAVAPGLDGVISFSTVSDRFYRVVSATTLHDQVWVEVFSVGGDGTEKMFTPPLNTDSRTYYRLLISEN